MASGHVAPHQQAGHMAASTSPAPTSKKTLAKGEPSTHGTSRTGPCPWGRPLLRAKPTSAIPANTAAFDPKRSSMGTPQDRVQKTDPSFFEIA